MAPKKKTHSSKFHNEAKAIWWFSHKAVVVPHNEDQSNTHGKVTKHSKVLKKNYGKTISDACTDIFKLTVTWSCNLTVDLKFCYSITDSNGDFQ